MQIPDVQIIIIIFTLFILILNINCKLLLFTFYEFICTSETYPRNNAAWESLEVEFLGKFGIPLFEKNYKVCK